MMTADNYTSLTDYLAAIKCKLFTTCASLDLCKKAVCALLRAKNRELPPILFPTFCALFCLLVLWVLYLLYGMYEDCPAESLIKETPEGDTFTDSKMLLVGDGKSEKPFVNFGKLREELYNGPENKHLLTCSRKKGQPPNQEVQGHYKYPRMPVQVRKCPAATNFIRVIGAQTSKLNDKDPNIVCRQQLANLLKISRKKCATQNQLRSWFRDQHFQVPIVYLHNSKSSQTKKTPRPKAKLTSSVTGPSHLTTDLTGEANLNMKLSQGQTNKVLAKESNGSNEESQITIQSNNDDNQTSRGQETIQNQLIGKTRLTMAHSFFNWSFRKPCRVCPAAEEECHQEKSVIINVTNYETS